MSATVHTCDGCGRRFTVTELDLDLPDGYHGTVRETGSWGGTETVEWFACRAAHIRGAVLNALTRKLEAGERE